MTSTAVETPSLVRSMHPNAFRAGEWAEVIGTVTIRGRDCWRLRFDDGQTDTVVIDDPAAGYEFA